MQSLATEVARHWDVNQGSRRRKEGLDECNDDMESYGHKFKKGINDHHVSLVQNARTM